MLIIATVLIVLIIVIAKIIEIILIIAIIVSISIITNHNNCHCFATFEVLTTELKMVLRKISLGVDAITIIEITRNTIIFNSYNTHNRNHFYHHNIHSHNLQYV